ncbi:MAG: hypothetical protein H2058_11900 [Muricauda sp.]|nr:hypothetical protein [Allomuricauda sp.]MBA4745949.1 hypothetical protein [Allomuricauda sp.]
MNLKFTKKAASVLTLLIVLTSCSSNKKEIEGKWWYEISSYGDEIIMFTSDGKAKNMNDDKLLDYTIEKNMIYLDGDTLIISKVSEKNLTLSKGKKTIDFRLANKKDYLIGDWEGSYENEKFEIDLKKDNDYKSRMQGKRNSGKYIINDNTLKVDNEEFNYELSEDFNNLTLTSTKNKVFKIELYRNL